MDSINSRRNIGGFSLIEVMIALLVIALGILGIAKLQAVLIKNATDANNRVQAMAIAQKKIDDLKSFIKLTSNTPWASTLAFEDLSYQHISGDDNLATFNETGGKIPAGPVDAADLDPDGLDVGDLDFQTEYTLNWQVNDYWHINELTAPVDVQPSPAPLRSDFKQLNVIVNWNDEAGEEQTVTLSTIINAYSPALTASSDNPSGAGNIGPRAGYTPLPAPDVVPVSLRTDGTKFKETSVPEPEVTKRDFATLVNFETVTYSNLNLAERREDFVTVACTCTGQPSTSTTNHTYGYLVWDSETLQFRDATYTVANQNNDVEAFAGSDDVNECRICCRDGQYEVKTPDTPPEIITENFQSQPFGSLGDLSGEGRDKVCRLKRIDGIQRVVKPWRLIAFNVIPASFFDPNQTSSADPDSMDNNIDAYSDYVEEQVRRALLESDSDETFQHTVDSSFFTDVLADDSGYNLPSGDALINHRFIKKVASPVSEQNAIDAKRPLQARAVYLDVPPAGYLENPDGTDFTPMNVPLDRIPFYETNVTNLAGWVPDENDSDFSLDSTNYVDLHDEAIQGSNVIEPCQNDYSKNCVSNQVLTADTFAKDYERGRFYPYILETTQVTARIFNGNDGLANVYINDLAPADSSIMIEVRD